MLHSELEYQLGVILVQQRHARHPLIPQLPPEVAEKVREGKALFSAHIICLWVV